MKAEMIEHRDRTVRCPDCGRDSKLSYEHLLSSKIFAKDWQWDCHQCFMGIKGHINPDGSCDIEPTGRRRIRVKTWDLLKIERAEGDIFFVVNGDWNQDDKAQNLDYWYGQHTCPTNWLGDVEEVFVGRNPDPHGIAQFVRSIPAPTPKDGPPFNDMSFQEWWDMFPEIYAAKSAKTPSPDADDESL